MASLKCGHLSSEVETQHYFPCQEWADTKLPMSEVTALVPEMKSSASPKNQS